MSEPTVPCVLHIDEQWPVLIVDVEKPDARIVTELPAGLVSDYTAAKRGLMTAEANIIKHLKLSGATRELENLAPFIREREGQQTDGA